MMNLIRLLAIGLGLLALYLLTIARAEPVRGQLPHLVLSPEATP
jgi:hypothetical protein